MGKKMFLTVHIANDTTGFATNDASIEEWIENTNKRKW